MSKEKILTNEMLQSAYTIIAEIVVKHGDTYLPIFKRLHEAVENRKAENALLFIAKRLVN